MAGTPMLVSVYDDMQKKSTVPENWMLKRKKMSYEKPQGFFYFS